MLAYVKGVGTCLVLTVEEALAVIAARGDDMDNPVAQAYLAELERIRHA